MRFSYQIFLLVFLAPLLCPSAEAEQSTKSNDIIGDIKKLLIRDEDKLTNATQPKHNANRTSGPLIPSDDAVGQIISLLNCGSFPLSPNSHLQYSLDYATKNLRLFQACDRYFKRTKNPESLQVRCKYKKWIFNEIGCKRTTCPRLTAPTGGHISTNDNTYNTTVYFWCSRGFSINGTDTLFCEESGLWNLPLPTCHVSYCSPLSSPRHGFVSSQEERATNQTVEFSCESEYSLIGDAVLRCQGNGRWNTTAPVCKKMCTVPKITNRSEGVRLIPKFKYLSIGSLLQQGQRIIFSCKPGYTVSSSGLSICIGGKWRPPIRCRKACVAVDIANGKYILSKDSSTIEYSCLPGYQLVGQQKLSCTPNITWDSEAPICTKLCTLPELPEVLSFRRKATYEMIPFGTQIINGTQVYFVCRSKTAQQISVTKCLNGELSPSPYICSTRLVNKIFEIYYNGNWFKICQNYDVDVCNLFGYRNDQYERCDECYHFDTRTFLDTSKIVLYDRRSGYDVRCQRCSKIK